MRNVRTCIVISAALLLLAGCGFGKSGGGDAASEKEATLQDETGREADGLGAAEPGSGSDGGNGVDGVDGIDGHGSPDTSIGIPQEGEAAENPQQNRAAICGQYFKAGDFSRRMEIVPGGPEDRTQLEVTFYKRARDGAGADFSNSLEPLGRFTLPYRAETSTYQVKDESGEPGGGMYTIKLHPDVVVELIGSEAAGMYYSCDRNLKMPDAFWRPLNETDLIGLEPRDLRLIRNEFYAVYGRIFNSEELRAYFRSKPWYRGTVEAGDFDESILGGLYRRNIAFLQEAEQSYDAARAGRIREDYAKLQPAPYLGLLPEYGEIYVNMASDAARSEDRGIYYAAEGTISVPITFSLKQRDAMERGETIQVTVDGLTGEKKALKKAPEGQSYGSYLLGEEAQEDYVMASFQPDSGVFYLWADSDDTRFKRVYEGEIYVLKGACEEFRGYFDLPRSEHGEGPGAFRVMDFQEEGAYGPEPYSGNVLVSDEKGYIKALYFYGD